MIQPLPWPLGVVLAALVAAAAWRARALSRSGAVAATLIGTAAVIAGWDWAVILIAYFASSSLLSRYRRKEKEARTSGRAAKDGARDAIQVIANGAIFAFTAVGSIVKPHATWQALGAAALAASAADTWATELGVIARTAPHSIIDWEPVAVGTSGGVTAQGFLAGAAGASFVVVVAFLVRWPPMTAIAALTGGFFGCLLDSVIGAAWQDKRTCPTCGLPTERRIHNCGTPTAHTAGYEWLDNDVVNFLATFGGALFGLFVARALRP